MAEQGGARLAWPDAAKGLGVLLVGLGHSRLLPEWASAWIYSFHMPLFFLLSGWFFSLRPGGVGATLRHKALPILMPYLAYNLAFFCWESAAAHSA
ncbi:acyltransferase family protein, partial [Lawsonibacter hominis]|uniref:acyltransferase family protein n=1 Tax=Lawsonibacter hominis TaxID=2763053 RepID=UPI00331F612A